jgi:hypothetical protein
MPVTPTIGSAISPEGWDKGSAAHYAHGVLGSRYLSCPFSPFRLKRCVVFFLILIHLNYLLTLLSITRDSIIIRFSVLYIFFLYQNRCFYVLIIKCIDVFLFRIFLQFTKGGSRKSKPE